MQPAVSYAVMRRVMQRANAQLGTNWSLHDLWPTAAARMAASGTLTLPEVQVVLVDAPMVGRATAPAEKGDRRGRKSTAGVRPHLVG